ncbi:MAG TPA: hypothetical protein VGV93_05410 [Acidimicrobiales bacterium]|nr:hypothetical protein [Acidimicrobiales bacterium]
MSHDRHLSIYCALTGLYPRSFRDDYREDLAVLFSHQISDESPIGVWARTIRDLAVTVPTLHLEAAMHRPPTPVLVGICSVVAASALALALVLGTGGPAVSIVFLMVAVVSAAVGVSAWRAQRPIRELDSIDVVWWKFLVAGVSLVAATFAGMAIPWPSAMDLGDNAYWLVVISMMTGFMLVGLGVLLGISALVRHHRHGPPATS